MHCYRFQTANARFHFGENGETGPCETPSPHIRRNSEDGIDLLRSHAQERISYQRMELGNTGKTKVTCMAKRRALGCVILRPFRRGKLTQLIAYILDHPSTNTRTDITHSSFGQFFSQPTGT